MKERGPDEVSSAVAVVGMAGRFPGARNIESLWRNLCAGRESITFFTEHEIDPSVDSALRNDSRYVRARGILDEVESFDSAFFRMSPLEAEVTDPQQRLFLECAWQVLEDAGYDPDFHDGPIGVYGGAGLNTYYINHVLPRADLLQSMGSHRTQLANAPDYLAPRVSHKLNLKGPSVSVYTGCSSSLAAVCLAFESLMTYQCDMALAGGTFVECPQEKGYLYEEGGLLSRDGYCRPFDARASGTVFSNGVGIVALKRLEDALREKAHIYCVIRGAAMNNDGSHKASFTAPSIDGQAEVIAMAHANAAVSPDSITYVEAHGTATVIGDPIEIAALTQAFRAGTSASSFCAIGSIKGNIGHLDAASGVAGLIKTALMLQHKMIPASLNFEHSNPEIDFKKTPFFVSTEPLRWETANGPRRAGVSSFGVGGTNVHVIVEEAPLQGRDSFAASRRLMILPISAKSEAALERATHNLSTHLKQHPDLNLQDVAYTLQIGRRAFPYRRVMLCTDPESPLPPGPSASATVSTGEAAPPRDVVFLFSGQGSQYVNMGLDLYRTTAAFRNQIDLCATILDSYLPFDLCAAIYPGAESTAEHHFALDQTSVAQPALFAYEYALAKMWMAWGLRPVAFLGHSIGEYVAACLAGVFSLQDALRIVAMRGRLMQSLPEGAMLAVFLPESELRSKLDDRISLAAVNGPSLCIASGPKEAVGNLERELSLSEINCRYLNTSHAFHSKMVEPIVESFVEELNTCHPSPPQIPFLSNVTGTWITAQEAQDPQYWGRHLRQTVRFSDCATEILMTPHRLFLEVGPGRTLANLLRNHPGSVASHLTLASSPDRRENRSAEEVASETVGRLWLAGIPINWIAFHENRVHQRVSLPSYPFQRQRCWLDPKAFPNQARTARAETPSLSLPKLNPCNEPGATTTETSSEKPQRNPSSDRMTGLIATFWQDILGVKEIRPDDNFFDLGGDSLAAVRLFSKIERRCDKRLPLATLFKTPTFKDLVALLQADSYTASWSPLVKLQAGDSRPPLFLVHAEGGNVLEYRDFVKHLGSQQTVYGLQAPGLEGKEITRLSIAQTAARYVNEIKKVAPHGPYLIGGYCLGGLIAFEMAQLLTRSSEEVALLALISVYTPEHLKRSVPDQTVFHRLFFRLLERIELEAANLSVQPFRGKISYLRKKMRRMGSIGLVRTEKIYAGLLSQLGRKYSNPSRQYILQASVELTDVAYMAYRPESYQGNVALFTPRRKRRGLVNDPFLGWRGLFTGRFEVRPVPGYHRSILREPNVRQLAQALRALLIPFQEHTSHQPHGPEETLQVAPAVSSGTWVPQHRPHEFILS